MVMFLIKYIYKIKKTIGIEKIGYTKILIETDDKLADDRYYFKNVVILITSVIKADDKFHSQVFLEEALVA